MPGTIKIVAGASSSRIVSHLPSEVIRSINGATSYKLPDAWARPGWNDRVYLFRKGSQTFPTGLLKRVKGAIRRKGYKTKTKDLRKQWVPNEDHIIDMLDSFAAQPRDYQGDGIIRGLEHPYGLFWWPTGSGKTVLFSALIRCYNLPTLILTHRKELLFQLQHEIGLLTGEEVGSIGAGRFDPKRWTVGLVNSLMTKNSVSRDSRVRKFLSKVEYLIVDECHHLGANSWWKIASLCVNTRARHGFSGTCFRTDNADLLLLAHTGDVISKYTTSQLIDWGWLSRPFIYTPQVKGKVKPAKTWANVERECIQNNTARNMTCCEFVYDRYDKGDQILIMVKLVEHGFVVKRMLVNEFGVEDRDIRYMSGSVGNEARKRALEDFKYGEYPILIGTSIYNEGVDLPTIGAAVNMAGGDSDIATTQRLGRAIRKKREEGEIDVDPDTEQTIHYMDPFDLSHRFVRRHSRSRMRVYEGERAFEMMGDYELSA